MMDMATILILGGYGSAGRTIARLLLQATNVQKVIIAGRNEVKAQQQSENLAAEFGAERISPLVVDAGDRIGLRQSLAQVGLVIVCLAYRGNQAENVLQAVLEQGIHYIDLSPNARKQTVLQSLAEQLAARGCIVLTEAGIVPGCPSMLARLAAQSLDSVQEITLGSLYRDRDLAYDGAYDLASHADEPFVVYKQGRWQRVSALATRRVFFGDRFGWQLALPVRLNELQNLPQKLDIENLNLYQGGLNPVSDGLLLLWKSLSFLRSERMLSRFARLFLWTTQRFTQQPFGIIQRLTAQGVKDGRSQQFTATLSQTDMYLATAIPVVAAACQILNGTIKQAGPQFMGHAVHPQRFMDEMAQLGMGVTIEESV